MWECEGSKSVRLDGFNFTFVKEFWEVLEKDIMKAMTDFHINGRWTN